jgi:hypothetical protein
MRASIEKAPGPSNAMTVVRTMTLSIIGLASKVNMTRPAEASPITMAAIGVMKPTNRQVAIIKMAAAASQLSTLIFSDPMYVSV